MIRPTTPVANRVNARELAAARAARAARSRAVPPPPGAA